MKAKIELLFVALTVFLLAVSLAVAEDPSGASISDETDLGEMTEHTASTVDVEAGNIKEANVDTNASTYHWAGLLGNVSGNIKLASTDETSMFKIIINTQGNDYFKLEVLPQLWNRLCGNKKQ